MQLSLKNLTNSSEERVKAMTKYVVDQLELRYYQLPRIKGTGTSVPDRKKIHLLMQTGNCGVSLPLSQ